MRGVGFSAVAGSPLQLEFCGGGQRVVLQRPNGNGTRPRIYADRSIDAGPPRLAGFGLRPAVRAQPPSACGARRRSDSEIRHDVALGLGTSGKPLPICRYLRFFCRYAVVEFKSASLPFCHL